MSPRRSSRARSSQLPPPGPNHANSTTSTTSKPDRDNRTSHRANSLRRSSSQPSESADGADSTSRAEQVAPRRSRRNGEDKEPVTKQQVDEEENDVEAADEEVTRCICGHAEYPGPSLALRQQLPDADALTDETGNFFVQCDNCGVWQHGGCMGFLAESILPDNYYCEQCKPEFHRVIRASNGPKSSRYIPIPEPPSSISSPLSSNPEMPRRKDSKTKQSEVTKRRATMNSRGAYDEDEMIRRAIEESKETGSLGKRTREESEDIKGNSKRLRTGSNSSDTVSKHSESPEPAGTEEGSSAGRTASQKLRGAAARNNREKEARDKEKEQQLAQRAEAANKRKARSERRRAEDSPPPTPSLSPSKAVQSNGKTKADSPPSSRPTTTTGRKAGGRPPARRGRLGRNQYTRDRENGDDESTPLRDASHDRNGGDKSNGTSPQGNGADGKDHTRPTTGHGHGHNINGESGRSSKAKTHPARTSLNEMKRRIAAILEFVGRMQTERTTQIAAQTASGNGSGGSSKGTNTPNGLSKSSSGSSLSAVGASALPTASLVRAVEAGLKGAQELTSGEDEALLSMMDEKDFKTMGSVDMMETLTKELVQWQSVYGVYSR
ncbi:Histone deacetylase complex subunit [Cladophialophora chaetospira]|uniref:Histone deacetylase complex subunit n=1 Tax=Cladophialophora chaetospira TaxID=386627 RepID=A0AA38XDQ5_9EURO|nr:Histone deacetylase complex subunit [Cladophialophora chaetospira]